jgi:hypothetical protein
MATAISTTPSATSSRQRSPRRALLALASAGGAALAAAATLVPLPALAWGDRYGWAPAPRPVGVDPYARPQNPWAYGDTYNDGVQPLPPVSAVPYGAPTPLLTAEQIAQRCQTGRLVGGIVGGGLGYAMSRQDGRAWAVPLGALLGTQVGCNVSAGRGPVPW